MKKIIKAIANGAKGAKKRLKDDNALKTPLGIDVMVKNAVEESKQKKSKKKE